MSVTAKLVGFAVGLAVVFAAALGIGRAIGPVADDPEPEHGSDHAGGTVGDTVGGTDDAGGHAGGHDDGSDEPEGDEAATEYPKGLMVSQDGYRLSLDDVEADPGRRVPVSFRILGPDGGPVSDYELTHEKELHLIAVRRDFEGFQHVHPVRDDAGVWRTRLALTSGTWRVFADFQASGAEAMTLGADLAVAGPFEPAPVAPETRTARVDDYEVTIAGDLTAGEQAELTLTVTRDGEPVTDLEPYLGAYGHLVALRDGDLAYLHVHPDGEPGDGRTDPGPDVVFYAEVPSPGGYHLYLDFKHEGVVRTAAFVLSAHDH